MNGIVLIGPPGSGKSTIGKALQRRCRRSMAYISSGDIAREMAKNNQQILIDLSRGKLAPESEMRSEIYRRLYDINYHKKIFILDGFPRFLDQMEWLQERFPKLLVIKIEIPEPTCRTRVIERGRMDDNEQAIRNRMSFYNEYTRPILLKIPHHVIDGIQSTNYCVKSIQEVIKNVENRKDR